MQAFRLQNFRGFRDTGWIQLKPLTLLVGANSTGKSSLLRFLPLLRQSMATQTGVPFAWAKEGGVDMGTAQDVHRRGATEPMRVGIRVDPDETYRWIDERHGDKIAAVPIEYELSLMSETSVGEPKQINLSAGRFCTTIPLTRSFEMWDDSRLGDSLATHNKWMGAVYFASGVIPDNDGPQSIDLIGPTRVILESIIDPPQNVLDHDRLTVLSQFTRRRTLMRSIFLAPNQFRDVLQRIAQQDKESTGINFSNASDEQLANAQAALWNVTLGDRLSLLRTTMDHWSQSIEYIGPARFPPTRYHRMWADRPKRLMPDGANLAVLFGGMSAAERDRFNALLQEALGYSLSLRSGTGNAELTLTNTDGDTFNIADLGFGLSQVLPVYLQAHLARRSLPMSHTFTSLFVVEQPELHLHPQLQAKLADLFVGMSVGTKDNPDPIPCFVETHSKALLERTGELVEEGAIPAEDVQVLLFEKDGKDCTVRTTTFDEQGILRDWPVGFLSR